MVHAYRLVRPKWAKYPLSGEGAAKNGGRWNVKGVENVHTSDSLALAALESLVHLDSPSDLAYIAFRIEFDLKLVETLDRARLASTWRNKLPATASQSVGTLWVQEGRTAVLAVPSVIVPSETNYLLNPHHPDFGKIRITDSSPFAIDHRLMRH